MRRREGQSGGEMERWKGGLSEKGGEGQKVREGMKSCRRC